MNKNIKKAIEVGWLSKDIIEKLKINDISINEPILLGETNIKHMMMSHQKDYEKYKDKISEIINKPDYAYLNKIDNSIELLKEVIVNNEIVRVAIRISNNKKLYVRTMFIISKNKLSNYLKNKKLIIFKY